MIELKFSSEDPKVIRSDMLAMLDLDAARAAIHAAPAGVQQGGQIADDVLKAVTAVTDTGPIGTGGVETTAASRPARRGRQPKPQTIEGEITSKTETPAPNISTQPENRIDPATAAQDKADEASTEQKGDVKVYTLEDVRAAAKGYIDRWDLDAASVDLVPCMMKAVGVGKMSELAALNDPAKFEAAAKAIDAAVAATDEDGKPVRYPTEG